MPRGGFWAPRSGWGHLDPRGLGTPPELPGVLLHPSGVRRREKCFSGCNRGFFGGVEGGGGPRALLLQPSVPQFPLSGQAGPSWEQRWETLPKHLQPSKEGKNPQKCGGGRKGEELGGSEGPHSCRGGVSPPQGAIAFLVGVGKAFPGWKKHPNKWEKKVKRSRGGFVS